MTLRGIGRDDNGKGMTLSTTELFELLKPILGENPNGKLVGQAARWFGRARRKGEDTTEWVLFWRNAGADDARWGLRKERDDEDVDLVLAAYAGRLAAIAIAKADDARGPDSDTEEGAPGGPPFDDSYCETGPLSEDDRGWASAPCAKKELERIREKRVRDLVAAGMVYEKEAEKPLPPKCISSLPLFDAGVRTNHDPTLVSEFVAIVEEMDVPRSTRLSWLSDFVSIPIGATRDQIVSMSEVARYFANFSAWEKNNVLLQLTDFAVRQLRERAIDWACEADPKRKKVER